MTYFRVLHLFSYLFLALYMTSLVLIVAGLFIKAFSVWLRLQDSSVKKENEKQTGKRQLQSSDKASRQYYKL